MHENAAPFIGDSTVTYRRDGRAVSCNGRPYDTHDRSCDASLHAEHVASICEDCGCCWGCEDDCCAEYTCPNEDCGCSDKPAPTYVIPPGVHPADSICMDCEHSIGAHRDGKGCAECGCPTPPGEGRA